MNEDPTKRDIKRAGPNPCVPMAVHFEVGDVLTVKHIIEGHVFAFVGGPKAPNIQYCNCIGCGRAIHVLYPKWYERKKNRKQTNEAKL